MSYAQRTATKDLQRGLLSDIEMGSSSTETAPLVSDESELQDCIRVILSKTSNVERFGQLLQGGDERVTHDLRNEIEKIKAVSAQAHRELSRLNPASAEGDDHSLCEQRRIRYMKLKSNLEVALKQFGSISMLALSSARTAATGSILQSQSRDENAEQEEEQAMESVQEQIASDELVLAASELQFNDELLAEREADIKGIQRDMEGIKTLYKELAIHVHTQGEDLDMIETNVITAVSNTEQAREQIEVSNNSARRKNKQYCCIFISILVALVVFIMIATMN